MANAIGGSGSLFPQTGLISSRTSTTLAPALLPDITVPTDQLQESEAAPGSYRKSAPGVDMTGILKTSLEGFSKAATLDEIKQKGPQLKEMAKSMISVDRAEVIGTSPKAMLENFEIDPADPLSHPKTAQDVWEMSATVLKELSQKVLGHVKDGQFHDLNPERMSGERKNDAVAQHVGYTVGMMQRDPKLKGACPGPEISRILLRKYFEGSLSDSSGAQVDQRQLLAQELSKAAGGSQAVADMVLSPDNDYAFSKTNFQAPESLLSNLASVGAGEATLEFATHMFEGNEKRASAFVKNVFGRPDEELQQLLNNFPSQVQLNPPDTRDVELFAWGRHRLKEHGYSAQDATRMALGLVVLTLHKDLLQIRKAA